MGVSERVGSELDLTWSFRPNRHTLFLIGYSHFFPGKFLEETGSSEAVDFSYLMLQYTF